MNRSVILLTAVLLGCILLSSVATAGNSTEPPRSVCLTIHCEYLSAETVANAVSTAVAEIASGIKLGAKESARLLREVGHRATPKSHQAGTVAHQARRAARDAFQQFTAEVRSLSVQVLRSAFSMLWALVSGLLRC